MAIDTTIDLRPALRDVFLAELRAIVRSWPMERLEEQLGQLPAGAGVTVDLADVRAVFEAERQAREEA